MGEKTPAVLGALIALLAALAVAAPAGAQSPVRGTGLITPGRIADARHAPLATSDDGTFLPPNLPNPLRTARKSRRRNLAAPSEPVAEAMPPADLNFDGMSTATTAGLGGVPDTNGDVGENHFVQIVNRAYAVWDKSGNQVLAPRSEAFPWRNQPDSDDCKSLQRGDPIVLYDPLAKRWLLSFFAFPRDAEGNHVPPYSLCVAVSTTSDPTGDWCPNTIPMANITGTDFPDYPKYGVWPDGYYVTLNVFPATGTGSKAVYMAFDRARMLNCQVWRAVYYRVPNGYHGGLPVDFDGATPPPAGSPGLFLQADPVVPPDPAPFNLLLYRLGPNYDNPGASLLEGPFSIPVPRYDYTVCEAANFQCVPQPGTTVKLEASDRDQLMYRLGYRNFGTYESLVANQTVAAATEKAAIRWYEIRAPFGTPSLYQSGTWASAGTESRWLGSIAQDKFGNIALGYNVSGPSTFPSLRYAGRVPGDALGTLGQDEATLVAGGGSKTAANQPSDRGRWGDYGQLTVDPVDDCTFWFTGEYLKQDVDAVSWWTRIGTFRMPGCVAATTTTSSSSTTRPPTTSTVTTSTTGTTTSSSTTSTTGTTSSSATSTSSTTSTTVPSSTLLVSDCKAGPGQTATCDVRLTLGAGVEVATLQFNATVEPIPLAPGLLGPVGFTQHASLPAPNINQAEGSSTVLVGWFSPPISPHLTGARAIGSLSVPVPASAQVGQSYRLRIVAPSATSDGSTDVPLVAGADGTLSVGRKFLVCDVSPSGVDQDGDGDTFDAGEFGNGVINNADIVAIFRAALLPDQRPPTDSDLFSAMDAAPEDVPPACGGNGGLVNSDVVLCFRRSLLPLSQYERTRGGGLCTATLAGSVPGAAEPIPLAAAPAEVGAQAVTLGRPAGRVVARRGSRAGAGGIVTLPVGFRPAGGARVATLQFAATVSGEGTVPALADGLRFEPARRYPAPDLAIVEGSRLLLGWLRPLPVTARRDVRLGRLRVRLPETAVRGDRYTVSFGPASGTAPGGEELRLDGGSVRLKAARRE